MCIRDSTFTTPPLQNPSYQRHVAFVPIVGISSATSGVQQHVATSHILSKTNETTGTPTTSGVLQIHHQQPENPVFTTNVQPAQTFYQQQPSTQTLLPTSQNISDAENDNGGLDEFLLLKMNNYNNKNATSIEEPK